MPDRNCLILTQYRNEGQYNDFIGKFYHFPASSKKNYLKQFDNLPIEIVYYEPDKKGEGVFYGYGKIKTPPFKDKREDGYYFVAISDYREFSNPVHFKNEYGEIIEKIFNEEFYNYNNAVRKINPKFLDELCLDGGILLNFIADAHLLQVLGEQLIASERVGILELVKNAFDAGAVNCNVRIEKVPNLSEIPENLYRYNHLDGPVIIIEDDGSGMTREQIEFGWLRPASTIKTNVKDRLKREKERAIKEGKLEAYNRIFEQAKQANKGRIPLGEKGVGRFACNRLGSKLVIKTKTADNEYEYLLEIDWDDFNLIDGVYKNLDDVKVSLNRQPSSWDYGERQSGTQLIIFGGRDGFELTEQEIKGINRTILKLNSPNPNPNLSTPLFKATFECPQVKELDERIITKKYDPVFQIYGLVDEWGNFEYDYTFTPPYNVPLAGFDHKDKQIDLKTIESKPWFRLEQGRKLWRKPACGAFYIHIDVWYRDKPWIGHTEDDREFKRYLEDYGGISIYRDGINVHSAELGTETDWLGLRQRQIKQAYRMSYYHMMGNVEIDQSSNIDLIDKTNREGMIKNRAFQDLTDLVKAVTYFVENDYINKRNEYNVLSGDLIKEPRPLRKFSKQSAKIISNINTNYDIALDQYKLFEDIEELGDISERRGRLVQLSSSLKNLEKNLKQIEEIQDMLTEQAGFGLGIAVALHEITKTTSNFYFGILEVIEKGYFDDKKLEELKDTSKALESEILRLSPLRALRNEEALKFNVSKSIKYVQSVFKRRFNSLDIEFKYNENEDFEIVARYGALNQILTNLFDNSCYWLDNPDFTHRKVEIQLNSVDRTMVIADSGPGFHDSILPYLFQPGASLKFPPSGIGLYVCKHYMNLMKKRGDIYLARERDKIKELNGAQLILDFSKVNY
ncbi:MULTISPECIES: sensor histidine kinase [unclassified Arenibacter]|uniref:sensor histidine kinase n=1 Tax=unclassified Arenibacter TaxID=2615047 RepID=UPI000E34114B|nr:MULTISPECIES: sensor histidine kinase [unclassified Arenibacter]MCM4162457.1 ATP-binding protein [Arenibacter sp. A80]RFT58049.1 ATP-binding protein [Arenibacter sp. P308M17]